MRLAWQFTWICLLFWTIAHGAGLEPITIQEDTNSQISQASNDVETEDSTSDEFIIPAAIPEALADYTHNWLQNYEQYHRVLQVGPVGFIDSITDDGGSIPIELPNTEDEIGVLEISSNDENQEDDSMDNGWLQKRSENMLLKYDNGSAMSVKSSKGASIATLSVAAAIAALVCFA